jgi:SPP1 family predicted phage head-tail adaptor
MTTFRQPGLRVGALRWRVTIQSLTVSVSDAGDRSEAWANFYVDEPAEVNHVSGGETLRGKQVSAGIGVVFVVRYRDNYNTTQRVVYDGVNYGIMFVRPVEGGRRYIELHCKADV